MRKTRERPVFSCFWSFWGCWARTCLSFEPLCIGHVKSCSIVLFQVLYTLCVCSVYVLETFCIGFVYVLYTFCTYSVHVLYMFCIRSVTFCIRSVHVQVRELNQDKKKENARRSLAFAPFLVSQ